MSAWIVDKANIDLLVEAFFRYEIPTTEPMAPNALGRLLWQENHRSVNYRYQEHPRTPRYTHEATRLVYQDGHSKACGTVKDLARDGLFVLMQIACYDYQSCEHPGWQASAAKAYITALESAILESLGMTADEAWNVMRDRDSVRKFGEYERYPWSIAYSN